ncbi:hypothetical protein NGM10_09500 [Halorussus salilacus]|uniref:hypothetical protein n=1 Tax=Halorussus salilacus TaxID=2953750 RepID=UPI0020A21602|nr:hypothetical protein [Halorussus salilacus]USZ66966.1 hypothetical protein NGM10_09500 [Halorussus salilacus]
MPRERESPSAGWREVYRELDAATDAEEATRACPYCGRTCENVLRDLYDCDEHGVFRPSTEGRDSAESGDSADPSPEHDPKNRASGTAD